MLTSRNRRLVPHLSVRMTAATGSLGMRMQRAAGVMTREELLSDPIIVALMAADGVDPGALDAMLNRVGQCRSSARRRSQCVRAD
jgi:hypothetical protein